MVLTFTGRFKRYEAFFDNPFDGLFGVKNIFRNQF